MNKPFTENASWVINRDALKLLPYKQVILFACDVARLTLHLFEQQFPEDKRPRSAIETTELFVYGQATMDQLEKTRSAANGAANAAYYAASNAAFVATAANCAANAAFYAANAAFAAFAATAANCTTNAAFATNAATAATAATDAANETFYAANNAVNAVNDAIHYKILPTIQTIYHQTTPITIPHTPILKAIAHNIRITRNFQEYNILLDNLEECHNIRLERIIPLGLSHYVLYHLTNTH